MPIPGLAVPGHAIGGGPLIDVIGVLGLGSNLKLCLDAGDASSFTSGQLWLDRAGGGYDFNRGSGAGSDSADPTFNGNAGGLSAAEYFSFDGGDYLTYDSANETWMNNIHKDNAKYTIVAWILIDSAGAYQTICGTASSGAMVGFNFVVNPTGHLSFAVVKGTAPAALVNTTVAGVSAGGWHFVAVSCDEAAGANGMQLKVDGTVETFASAYTSPSAASATYTMQVGAAGNAVIPISGNGRVAELAAWEGAALTAAQIDDLYQVTRGRFGV